MANFNKPCSHSDWFDDHHTGDSICSTCGLVLESGLDIGSLEPPGPMYRLGKATARTERSLGSYIGGTAGTWFGGAYTPPKYKGFKPVVNKNKFGASSVAPKNKNFKRLDEDKDVASPDALKNEQFKKAFKDLNTSSSSNKKAYPGCQHIECYDDVHTGDSICTECGLVVQASLDIGNFEPPSAMGSNLGTYIGHPNDTGKNKEFKSGTAANKGFQKLAAKYNFQRTSLEEALTHIATIAARIHLPSCIIERARKLFSTMAYNSHDQRQGAYCAACLYIACRQEGAPRTFKEICSISEHSKKSIGRAFEAIRKKLCLELQTNDALELLPRFCSTLRLTHLEVTVSQEILKKMNELKLSDGHSPTTVASMAIYLAANLEEKGLSRNVLCKTTGVAWTTMSKYFKDKIANNMSNLLPKGHRNYELSVGALPNSTL